MKHKVRITALPKAQQGLYTKAKLTNNAFQFPVNFKEGMKPGFDVKKNLGPTDRDKANIEAEKGETIITPMGDDAWTKTIPKTYVIGGKKHYKGGTPLSVPEGSFIYSDHLKERNPEMHKLFNRPEKKSGYTYADLSKPYMLNDDIRRLLDNDSDKITKDTARLNIMNKVDKLGLLSLLQESQKGFTDDQGEIDLPTVGVPYIDKAGINIEEAVQPFLDAIKQPVQQPQQPMMGQPMMGQQPGMSPEMMPEMMMPPQMMQQQMQPEMPMKLGGLVKMKKGGAVGKKKYVNGGPILGEDERVRFNSSRNVYEVVNSEGKVVGVLNVSGKSVKIKKSEIPSDATIIKKSDYASDTEFEKAKKDAYANAGGKPVVIESDGGYKLLSQKASPPSYTGSKEDLDKLFAGQDKVAAQYEYIQTKFADEAVKKELANRAIAALKNPDNRATSMTNAEAEALIAKLEGTDGPEYAYKMFMDMQKRNLSTAAYSFANKVKAIKDHPDAADPGDVTNADFRNTWNTIGLNVPTEDEAKIQQALYIGYRDLITDYKAGKVTDDVLKEQLKDFDIGQVGSKDPADLSGTGSGKVSKIDGDYTNTTTGQVVKLNDITSLFEEDLPETEETVPQSPEYVKQPPVGGWTAPDIANYFGAVNEIYADQPQTPFIAQPGVYLPGVAVMSPEDMQRQIRGQLGAQSELLQAYAGPQATMSALTATTGADELAAQTAAVHNANIGIINQAEQNKAATLNQAALNSANLTTTLRDRWAQLKDNLQARKSAAKAEARKAFGIGESNEGAFQAMNLQTPNYQWDPFTQDFAGFTPSGPIEPTTEQAQTSADLFAEYKNRFPGVSDASITQLVKADMGIQETPADYWSMMAANREGIE
jgi:hypothetical protein